ncbi:cytochrome P450 family protein [Abortiporus biennis]
MISTWTILFSFFAATVLLLGGIAIYWAFILPLTNPLKEIPGPPISGFYNISHMEMTINPTLSPRTHARFLKDYGRNVHIRGPFPWDDRLISVDPVAISYILKNTSIYEKPWQSRAFISSLIGCGMLSAEGKAHKRFRRVATPAFSIQHLRDSKVAIFQKGLGIKKSWMSLIETDQTESESQDNFKGTRFDVCDWIYRATFDVIGVTGFDYDFNAIGHSDDELYHAYKEMFEAGIAQQKDNLRVTLGVYVPLLYKFFPDQSTRTVARCRAVIERVAGGLIQEKKRKILEAEKQGITEHGREDLLTLLLKSNQSESTPPSQRLSDEDILNNINTLLFAGSDTTALSITWTLLLLAMYPELQTRLRNELLSISPSTSLESLSPEEVISLYDNGISTLPYLDNVVKETLRLIPPVHSSMRCATQDDVIPTSSPMKWKVEGEVFEEKKDVKISKGTFIHIPIEAFHLDKEVWGEDAWSFDPDRWDHLPDAASSLPGLYANLLTFSAGPRSCIGYKFSIVEIKTFLFILLTKFVFKPTGEKIGKANVVLTRPYLVGNTAAGSQCPIFVAPYISESEKV